MQGAGNDFVLLDRRPADSLDSSELADLARQACRRRVGVGADGLLVLLASRVADVRMRMFNPDGTEDDCGNGLRCVALRVLRAAGRPAGKLSVETLTGLQEVSVEPGVGSGALVTVRMPPARLAPGDLPALSDAPHLLDYALEVDGEVLRAHTVFTGSTHTVLFRTPDDAEFQRLSSRVESHPLFPMRTSVLWAAPAAGEVIRVRIWERGVGETLGCGTGAAAVAVAGRMAGKSGDTVVIRSRGGDLRVTVADDLSCTLTGPARDVYTGRFGPDPWRVG